MFQPTGQLCEAFSFDEAVSFRPNGPFDCLARAIGPGRIGALTKRPEGPSASDRNKWPTIWASGCLGNRKPGPMAQAVSMAGPLARNHMSRLGEDAPQRCLSGLNGKTLNDSRFNQDPRKRLPSKSCLRSIEPVSGTLAARRRTLRQTPRRQSHHARFMFGWPSVNRVVGT